MGRMKGLVAILGAVLLMVVVAACGNGAEPTSLSDEVPTQAPPTVGGTTPTEPNTPTTPIVSHGGPVKDYVSLVDNLRAAGATVSELSMVILLPDTGQFEEFEASLDADLVRTITEDLVPTRVALTMPKFEFESDFGLSPNPPKDTDGRREGSGRGWVRELQGRWPGVLG